jgi:hypothetical protein
MQRGRVVSQAQAGPRNRNAMESYIWRGIYQKRLLECFPLIVHLIIEDRAPSLFPPTKQASPPPLRVARSTGCVRTVVYVPVGRTLSGVTIHRADAANFD